MLASTRHSSQQLQHGHRWQQRHGVKSIAVGSYRQQRHVYQNMCSPQPDSCRRRVQAASTDGMPMISVQPGGNVQFPLQLPLLPFTPQEAMTPGMTKPLHLFEARYLEMLEEVLASPHRLFAHVVVEQPVTVDAARRPGALVTEDYVMCMATLVKVLEVRPVQPGALVRIQAEGRLKVLALQQMQPFLRATVAPLYDLSEEQLKALAPLRWQQQQAGQPPLAEQVEALKEVMRDVQNLASKFRSEQTANLQAALYWAEAAPVLPGTTSGCHLEELACRLSFAALQSLPQALRQEQMEVAQQRIEALESMDTRARLVRTTEIMTTARGMLAAKVALKSLNLK